MKKLGVLLLVGVSLFFGGPFGSFCCASLQENDSKKENDFSVQNCVRKFQKLSPNPRMKEPETVQDKMEEIRHARLTIYSKAMIEWMNNVSSLSSEQKDKIEEITTERCGKLKSLPRKSIGEQYGAAPFEFTKLGRMLSHDTKFREKVDSVLLPEQKEKINRAMDRRDLHNRHGIAGMATVLLDQKLFLRSEKRNSVNQILAAEFEEKHYVGLFTTSAGHIPFSRSYFPSGSLPKMKKLLSDTRFERYHKIVNDANSEDMVFVTSTVTEKDLLESLDQLKIDQKKNFNNVIELYITSINERKKLSSGERKKLKLFTKKIVRDVVDAFTERCRKEMIKGKDIFGIGAKVGFRPPNIKRLLEHQMWKKICEQWGLERNPKKFYQNSMVDYMLAIIDQEIWLLETQRQDLRLILENSLSRFSSYDSDKKFAHFELTVLADALRSIDDKKIKKLLTRPQLEAWCMLKSRFIYDRDSAVLTDQWSRKFPRLSLPNKKQGN